MEQADAAAAHAGASPATRGRRASAARKLRSTRAARQPRGRRGSAGGSDARTPAACCCRCGCPRTERRRPTCRRSTRSSSRPGSARTVSTSAARAGSGASLRLRPVAPLPAAGDHQRQHPAGRRAGSRQVLAGQDARLPAWSPSASAPTCRATPRGSGARSSRALGVEPLELGRGMPTRINPLDPGRRPDGLDDDAWSAEVRCPADRPAPGADRDRARPRAATGGAQRPLPRPRRGDPH